MVFFPINHPSYHSAAVRRTRNERANATNEDSKLFPTIEFRKLMGRAAISRWQRAQASRTMQSTQSQSAPIPISTTTQDSNTLNPNTIPSKLFGATVPKLLTEESIKIGI